MNIFLRRHIVRHLEPQCDVCTRMKVSRKSLVWGVSVYHKGARREGFVGELRVKKKYGGRPVVGLVPARTWVGRPQVLGMVARQFSAWPPCVGCLFVSPLGSWHFAMLCGAGHCGVSRSSDTLKWKQKGMYHLASQNGPWVQSKSMVWNKIKTKYQIVGSQSVQARAIHGCDTQLLYGASGPTVVRWNGSCRAIMCVTSIYICASARHVPWRDKHKGNNQKTEEQTWICTIQSLLFQSHDGRHAISTLQLIHLRLTHFQCSQYHELQSMLHIPSRLPREYESPSPDHHTRNTIVVTLLQQRVAPSSTCLSQSRWSHGTHIQIHKWKSQRSHKIARNKITDQCLTKLAVKIENNDQSFQR